MTRVVVVGERGEVTQTVKVGPAVLTRPQEWDDLPRLTGTVRLAGLDAEALDPRETAGGLDEPDCWLLSDVPFAAAASSGLWARMTSTSGSGGLLMLGGALSFAGQQGIGGWAASNPQRMWPVVIDTGEDTIEVPDGTRLVATADCPTGLARIFEAAPPVFGYNRVAIRPEATLLAEYGSGAPAIATMERDDRRRAVFTSDLMPHWGAETVEWDGLPELMRALVRLVVD